MKVSRKQLRRIIREEYQRVLKEQARPNLAGSARGRDLEPVLMGQFMDSIGFAEAGGGPVVISGDQIDALTFDEETENVNPDIWVPLVQQIMAAANSTTFESVEELIDYGIASGVGRGGEPLFTDPGYESLYRSGKLVIDPRG